MITDMTFIFPYHLASYLKMTHTQSPPPGNQSERNTSCVDSLISDKPDSKSVIAVIVVVIVIGRELPSLERERYIKRF